jgi:lipopolysaccharide biosynthesis protein
MTQDLTQAPSHPSVVIFVHVFYPDVWSEMARVIAAHVATPFRLVITTPLDPSEIAPLASPFLISQMTRTSENRGRDILPFLLALEAEEPFEIGLKLHTKRSPHRADGHLWRQSILASLLPPPPGVDEIISAFRDTPKLGLLAPEGLLLPLRDRLNDNRRQAERLAAEICGGHGRALLKQGWFAAGSMFWFRRSALQDLSASRLIGEFPPERGQLDSTGAHALERLFVIAAEHRGFVALPADALAQASSVKTKEDAHRIAAERPPSEHSWLPSLPLLIAQRYVPFLAWTYRRIPLRLQQGLRRILPSANKRPPRLS